MADKLYDIDTIAKFFRKDNNTISFWVRNYGMPTEGHGKYDFVKCVDWYIKHLEGQNEKANLVTRKELAKLLGYKNEKYINELERDFGLPKKDFNKYDIYEVIEWFIGYKENLHKKELEKIKETKPQDELARKSARLKELEILEREGKLIDAELNKIVWLEEYKMLSEKLDMFSIAAAGKIIEKFKELAKHEKTIKSIIEVEKDKIKNEIAEYPLEKEIKTND